MLTQLLKCSPIFLGHSSQIARHHCKQIAQILQIVLVPRSTSGIDDWLMLSALYSTSIHRSITSGDGIAHRKIAEHCTTRHNCGRLTSYTIPFMLHRHRYCNFIRTLLFSECNAIYLRNELIAPIPAICPICIKVRVTGNVNEWGQFRIVACDARIKTDGGRLYEVHLSACQCRYRTMIYDSFRTKTDVATALGGITLNNNSPGIRFYWLCVTARTYGK